MRVHLRLIFGFPRSRTIISNHIYKHRGTSIMIAIPHMSLLAIENGRSTNCSSAAWYDRAVCRSLVTRMPFEASEGATSFALCHHQDMLTSNHTAGHVSSAKHSPVGWYFSWKMHHVCCNYPLNPAAFEGMPYDVVYFAWTLCVGLAMWFVKEGKQH